MAPRPAPRRDTRTLLLVHPDLATLSAMQATFTEKGFTCIAARDVSTALLAVTQHYFDAAITSSHISEEGDGWPLGGVLRFVFPRSFVAVIAPETSVVTLQAAINHGLSTIFEKDVSPEEMARSVLSGIEAQAPTPRSVQ